MRKMAFCCELLSREKAVFSVGHGVFSPRTSVREALAIIGDPAVASDRSSVSWLVPMAVTVSLIP